MFPLAKIRNNIWNSHAISRGAFNSQFGQLFPEPKVLSTETPKISSPADPEKKMSKSLGSKHYIGLFEDETSIRAKIRGAVTDSGTPAPGMEISPGVTNLFEILKACGKNDDAASLLKEYESGNRQYSRLKEAWPIRLCN